MNDMSPEGATRRRLLEDAIARAGGIVKFARAMGVTLQAVTLWRKQKYVPLNRAVQIEALYHIPRERLVPADIAASLAAPRNPSSDVL